MRKWLLITILCATQITLWSQTVTDIAYAPDTIYVGDVVSLRYSIDTEGKQLTEATITFDNVKNIAHDTLIEGSVATMDIEPITVAGIKADDKTAYIAPSAIKNGILEIKVGVFDAGVFMPPSIVATVDGRRRALPMKQIGIPVLMRVMTTEDTDVGDIQDIILEKKNWTDYLWIAWILGAIIALLLAWYLWKKYGKKEEETSSLQDEEIIPEIPAHEEALEALHNLQKSEMWKNGDEKEYHSQLTYIVRRYLSRRYDVPALEMTTDEVGNALRSHSLPSDISAKLSEILSISDIVKFAKGETSTTLNERFLMDAIDMVEKTKRSDV